MTRALLFISSAVCVSLVYAIFYIDDYLLDYLFCYFR